jgi:hypothetical protein
MKSKGKYLTIKLKEFYEEDNQKTDGGTAYNQIFINKKLQIGKRGQKAELTGRGPLRN